MMKKTKRAEVEGNILERARVRTMGAIRPLNQSDPIQLDALATELGFTVVKAARLAALPNQPDTKLRAEDAVMLISAALDRLGDSKRILKVHAKRGIRGMVWATDLATWIGVPPSEVWFQASGWDSVLAAAEHGGVGDYDVIEAGVTYGQVVARYEDSQAAWDEFDMFATIGDRGWIGYTDAKRIARDLGAKLPWPAKAIINAIADGD